MLFVPWPSCLVEGDEFGSVSERHTPGAEAPSLWPFEKAKPEGLAYPEARATTKATAKANCKKQLQKATAKSNCKKQLQKATAKANSFATLRIGNAKEESTLAVEIVSDIQRLVKQNVFFSAL